MKKWIVILLAILVLMYAEYRYIMLNLRPFNGDNGTVYIEIFGNVDEYYTDPTNEIKGE